MIVWKRYCHHPSLGAIGPEDFRIAKIGHVKIQDRILSVLGPGSAAIIAKGEVLRLEGRARCGLGSVRGIDCYETRLRAGAESTGVVLIDDGAAGKDHDAMLFRNSDRQFTPMHQIAADGVAPTHVTPAVGEGIELEEQMILAIEVDQTVGIVGPIARRGKMELGPIGLLVRWRLGEEQDCDMEKSC